jgi:hypothetical protein
MPLNGKRGCILVSTLLALGIASARADGASIQAAPATENVTVTGTKPTDAAIGKFVEALTIPTRAADKLARWRDGVCPLIVGARPEVGIAIVKKIREVAATVGAPVNTREGCPNNIEVIFTTEPQALLDDVRVMHPNLLGYFDNSAQAEQLATMRSAIQSWYITASVDRKGQVQVDGARKGGVTLTMMLPQAGWGGPSVAPTMFTMNLPNATAAAATDGRLGDGISSTITNVVIVADTSKLLNREVGVLADYIAMLALSQVRPPDGCQEMPTILNLLVPDCSRATGALTAADIAYLKGLYKMTPNAKAFGQRDEIRYQMKKALGADQ